MRVGFWIEGRALGKVEKEQEISLNNEGEVRFWGLQVC